MKESILTILRDKATGQKVFRSAAKKLADIIAAEESTKIKQKKVSIETALSSTEGMQISENICLIPILRSGLALLPSFSYFFEEASIGVLGIRRNETTFKPNLYYDNLPLIEKDTHIIILDPMIATGGTICMAAKLLISKGAKESNIRVASILSTKEGLKLIKNTYKDIGINTVAIDDKLNDKKLIVPGLGDFGDRFFGTL